MLYFDCFTNAGTKPIVAIGYVYQNNVELNMSSIYTKLIQEAGRFCDSYASDLLIDIDSIETAIEKHKSKTFYIGFRDMGVDCNAFIECRTPNECREYRAIWKLELEFAPDDYYEFNIRAVLQQVYYSYSDHEWKRLTEGK